MATQTLILIDDGGNETAPDHRVSHSQGQLSVRSRRLYGGRKDGLQLVELTAGTTTVSILPDRGLGIWKIVSRDLTLGWQSPLKGPVHPRFVPLAEPSGLGWLNGFDELVARCGLVSNGAADFDSSGRLRYGLHGQIANLPAHQLQVTLDDTAGTISLTGAVDETRFLFQALRMTTTLTVHADRPRVGWRDKVENLSDRPASMQMLYHVNFGPPLLGANAELVAAIEELAPRDAGAASDVPTWSRYDAPQAGRMEQVHFAKVRADADGWASALLIAPDRANAATLAWRGDTLPYFSLWKNQAGLADGYVTGFEPGTNFPNPRSFEESQGRVVPLAAHASVQFDLAIEHHAGSGVESARLQLLSLGANNLPRIHDQPRADWSR
ncbi:MAG: aldose 1-epimerase family protein [Planctomycetia bacterium]|nr:aldose 1-epimerase family protein [Planctomycetia bacterium]RLT14396.1 MAG: DUF4432 family protein [Planctomycetota bacterium]